MQHLDKLYRFFFKHSFMRYLFIGGTTFTIDFGLLVFLHGALGVNVVISASVSYWLSILFNFSMNRAWTFGKRDLTNLHKHLVGYAILLGFNYLFTIMFISVGVKLGMHYTIAKAVSVVIQTFWTYLVYKKIIFKYEKQVA